jgi:phosphatidylserine decarboxylase
VAIAIDTPKSSGLGRVTVVMVAAIVVGRITVTGVPARDVPLGDHAPGVSLSRGDELGMFHLGSTVVLFVERAAMGAWLAREGAIRYGEGLVRAPSVAARVRA